MKKILKQCTAFLMVAVMLMGLIPDTILTACAEEIAVETENVEEDAEPVEEEVSEPEEAEQETEAATTEVTVEAEPDSEVVEETTEEVTEGQKTEETESATEEETGQPEAEDLDVPAGTEQQTDEEIEIGIREDDFLLEEKLDVKEASDSYVIYSDGSWSGGIIWYVNDGSKKHYVFCLNKGMTMYSGQYSGKLVSGYSGKSAFKKAVALNYFYQTNGSSWNGKKNYGPVQEVIWDETGSNTAKELTTYIDHAWKLTDLNSSRKSGSGAFDSRLTPIKKSDQESASARKTMASKITNSPVKLSEQDTQGYFSKTISLSGTAWKYFAKGGYTGSASDISVSGVYDEDGKKVSTATASVNTSGKLSVKIKPEDKKGNSKSHPLTVVLSVGFDYKGSSSLRYLETAAGKQNLSYDTSFSTAGYFAIQVYANGDVKDSIVYVNKVDEFGNFLPGCTFRMTGTGGEALTNKVSEDITVMEPLDDEYAFEVKYPGTYQIVETAVPAGGEYELNTAPFTFYAEKNSKNELVVYTSSSDKATATISFTYTCENRSKEGGAELIKYGKVLVGYQNGQFVYEDRVLGDVGFSFYAAEDVSIGDTVIFTNGEEIKGGRTWGKNHTVVITGRDGTESGIPEKNYTDDNGKMGIQGLPVGSYYCVETEYLPGFSRIFRQYAFEVTADTITKINEPSQIINESAPAECYVYKVDADTKEPLGGGEFTIYADVDNVKYDGTPLFTQDDTVPAVIRRNLLTGDEIIVDGKWVPIRTVVTTADGKGEFDSLPYGVYLVVETKAPEGYSLAEESFEFEHIPQAEQGVNGYHFEHTFLDEWDIDVEIVKHAEKANPSETDEKEVYIYSQEPVIGVQFGIYAAEDIYNTLGEKVLDADAQAGTCTTDEHGVATYTGHLFFGKYYFKELKTADDSRYMLDDNRYPFVVSKETKVRLNEEPIVNKLYKGSIKVIKTDGQTKALLQGVTFNLLDADKKLLGSYVTDEKGEIQIQNLPVGTYYIQEAGTLNNYYLQDDLQEVSISKENLDKIVNIDNARMTGSIKVIKTDGKTTYRLAGVEFELLDEEEQVIGSYVTDQNGEINIAHLEIGRYYIRETKALRGYELSDEKTEVVISPEALDQIVNITNERMTGSIRVIKTDGRTKYRLKGVEFELLDEEEHVIGSYVTDQDGEIYIDQLEIGTYYIKETKALKGYKLPDEPIEVEISPEHLNEIVKVKNDREETEITVSTERTVSGTGSIRTGDAGMVGTAFTLLLFAGILAAFLSRKKSGLHLENASAKGKRFFIITGLLIGGTMAAVTVKAASGWNEISSKEITNAEYEGKIYTYAIQKQYETTDPEETITFDKTLNGQKLQAVDYQIVDTIVKKKTLEESRDYKKLLEKDETAVKTSVQVDGNTYTLQDITWSEEPNVEHVRYVQDYGYAVAEPEFPALYAYTYTSPVTGKDNTVNLPFAGMEKGEAAWVDGFVARVTFHNLDGRLFQLGSHEFFYNPDTISFTESDYTELVRLLGYDTSKYRLGAIWWSGSEYRGEDGRMNRDALASGQQYAASYKAVYEDDVENGTLYTAHAIYTCEVELSAEEEAPTYVMQATGYYETSKATGTVLISVGIAVLIILAVGVLYVISRKQKKEQENKD